MRIAVVQYRWPFIGSGTSRHKRNRPEAAIAAADVSTSLRLSTGAVEIPRRNAIGTDSA